MRWKTLLILLVAFGAYQHFSSQPAATLRQPGITAPENPRQIPLQDNPALSLAGYDIEPLAAFSLQARVLGAEHYRLGREAEISPVDLALGWGPMSDSAVLERIDIRQGNRFYFWRTENFPIPRQDIETHSANMHMIPADASIARQLKTIRSDQIVRLRGYLVAISAADGWRWRSSLTRSDTGNGACELVWVESLEVI